MSVLAAIDGDANLAIGNAVGSNVSNVTLVIGVTALVAPLSGSARVLKREGIAMLLAVVALTVLIYDLTLTRTEGLGLIAAMLVAAVFIVRWARQDADIGVASLEQDAPEEINRGKEAALGILSLLATLAGAEMLVKGGSSLASAMGVGSAFIGMTVVAVGTSLPELATSIAGVRRNEDDLGGRQRAGLQPVQCAGRRRRGRGDQPRGGRASLPGGCDRHGDLRRARRVVRDDRP